MAAVMALPAAAPPPCPSTSTPAPVSTSTLTTNTNTTLPPARCLRPLHATPAPAPAPAPAAPTTLDSLPTEVVHNILSYLTHPRSRLPGLTEAQSDHEFPHHARLDIKNREDLTSPPDTERWAANIFAWGELRHPFLVLSRVSRRCNRLVESYTAHLARSSGLFRLPYRQWDRYGKVYPDLSHIVWRRLWLQQAPRRCIYCTRELDIYPFLHIKSLVTACQDCFYRQTLTVDEVERQYHISPQTTLTSNAIRGLGPECQWVLRVDVENMAHQLYGTRAFHSAHVEQFEGPCSICAITRFKPVVTTLSSRVGKRASPRSSPRGAVAAAARRPDPLRRNPRRNTRAG